MTHLADRAGVARTQLWAVFRGEASPTLAWLEKIAEALGVEVIDLLRDEAGAARDKARNTQDT